MNKQVILLLLLFGVFGNVFAQARMVNSVSFEENSMAAYELQLEIAPDRVIDLWDDFWDDNYKVDVDREDRNREREIYLAKAVTVESISEKKIDIYSAITTQEENRATVSLGFGVGYDVYAGEGNYPTVFAAAERILNEFETYSYRKVYAERVEEREDMLKEAVDNREDLEDTIEKSNKEIERAKEKIADLEKEIEEARQKADEAQNNMKAAIEKVVSAEQELKTARTNLSKWDN